MLVIIIIITCPPSSIIASCSLAGGLEEDCCLKIPERKLKCCGGLPEVKGLGGVETHLSSLPTDPNLAPKPRCSSRPHSSARVLIGPWLRRLQAPVVKTCFIFSSSFNVCRWHPGKRAVLKGKAVITDRAVMDGILTGDGLSALTVVRNASHSPGPQSFTATSVRAMSYSAGLGFSSRLFKVYAAQTHMYMCL